MNQLSPKIYYDTNDLAGLGLEFLEEAGEHNYAQEKKVEEFFRENPDAYISACVVNRVVLPGAHRGSVSRCLTNLTGRGVLEKTKQFASSDFSVRVHTWKLKTNHGQPTQAELPGM